MKKIKTKVERQLSKRVAFLESQLMNRLIKGSDMYECMKIQAQQMKEEVKSRKDSKKRMELEKQKEDEKNHNEIINHIGEITMMENDFILLSLDTETKKAVIISREYLSYPVEKEHPLGFGSVSGKYTGYVCAAYLIDWDPANNFFNGIEDFLSLTDGSHIRVQTVVDLHNVLSTLRYKQGSEA